MNLLKLKKSNREKVNLSLNKFETFPEKKNKKNHQHLYKSLNYIKTDSQSIEVDTIWRELCLEIANMMTLQ